MTVSFLKEKYPGKNIRYILWKMSDILWKMFEEEDLPNYRYMQWIDDKWLDYLEEKYGVRYDSPMDVPINEEEHRQFDEWLVKKVTGTAKAE